MASPRRVLLPGYPHYLLRNTSARRVAFGSASDFRYAVNEIRSLSVVYALDVHAFCVLPDGIHLLATPRNEVRSISTFMKAISSRIALRNRRIYRLNSPWTPRFFASTVEPGQWVLSCMAHMERLPVRMGLVRAPGYYQFSSFYVRGDVSGSYWLSDPLEYFRLGDSIQERADVWKDYLRAGADDEEAERITTALRKNRLMGSAKFVEQVRRDYGMVAVDRGPGRPRKNHQA